MTVFPDFGGRGDCYEAALASIVDVRIEEVPVGPIWAEDGEAPWEEFCTVTLPEWLAGLGLGLFFFTPPLAVAVDALRIPGYWIAHIPSENPMIDHAVVCYQGRVVHDPSPAARPDSEYLGSIVRVASILTALDPSEWKRS